MELDKVDVQQRALALTMLSLRGFFTRVLGSLLHALNSDGEKLKRHTFALRENEACGKYFFVMYTNRFVARGGACD